MQTVRTTVILTVEHDVSVSGDAAAHMAVPAQSGLNIVFVGNPRPADKEARLGEMIGIKEHMKLAYARLKRLHVNTFVYLYQDLIQALLKI